MKCKIISIAATAAVLLSMTFNTTANATYEQSGNCLVPYSTEDNVNSVSPYAAGLISYFALSCTGGTKTIYITSMTLGTTEMKK